MKRIVLNILLIAVSAFFLLACEKRENPADGGRIVFSASPSGATKTHYSNVVSGGLERIDWVEGDIIVIGSDRARAGADNKSTYSVGAPTANGAISAASVSPVSGDGLYWSAKNTVHQFWGVYPAASDFAVTNNTATFTGIIPAAQLSGADEGQVTITGTTGSTNGMICYSLRPALEEYGYLVAVASANSGDGNSTSPVTLPFTPAYTALRFFLTAPLDSDITLHSLTLASQSGALSGDFTATGASTGWTYDVEVTDSDKSLELSFAHDGVEGFSLPAGQHLTFAVICPPNTLGGLTASFDITYARTYHEQGGSIVIIPNERATKTTTSLVGPFASQTNNYLVFDLPRNSTIEAGDSIPLTPDNFNAAGYKTKFPYIAIQANGNGGNISSGIDFSKLSHATLTFTAVNGASLYHVTMCVDNPEAGNFRLQVTENGVTSDVPIVARGAQMDFTDSHGHTHHYNNVTVYSWTTSMDPDGLINNSAVFDLYANSGSAVLASISLDEYNP